MKMNQTFFPILTHKNSIVRSILKKEITQYKSKSHNRVEDVLTVEEPLEIRVKYHTQHSIFKTMRLAVTMRTPGDDPALATGFLFTESIVQTTSDIDAIDQLEENIVLVTLTESVHFDADRLRRNFYTTSSCGVCGKASIESIHSETVYLPWTSKFSIAKEKLFLLPEKLRKQQSQFEKTGGIHACALVNSNGEIVHLKEDVGRHNAMDKLIGSWKSIPISDHLVLVSGRASFELVQKGSKAGIPMLVSIGAPSSLAVQLAEEQGMGLIGFLKSDGFNHYVGVSRVSSSDV